MFSCPSHHQVLPEAQGRKTKSLPWFKTGQDSSAGQQPFPGQPKRKASLLWDKTSATASDANKHKVSYGLSIPSSREYSAMQFTIMDQ